MRGIKSLWKNLPKTVLASQVTVDRLHFKFVRKLVLCWHFEGAWYTDKNAPFVTYSKDHPDHFKGCSL